MEANRKFVVESGSARGENISIDEVNQALRDIDNWLKTNIPSYSANPGLEHCPEGLNSFLAASLRHSNGGIQLQETFKTLSLAEIESLSKVLQSNPHWDKNSLPFAKNCEDELLLVRETGEVVQWSSDEGIGENLAKNLGLFIEGIRNNMLSRKYQYLGEDCGLVEAC